MFGWDSSDPDWTQTPLTCWEDRWAENTCKGYTLHTHNLSCFKCSNIQSVKEKEGEIKECVLTTLVGGAAAVCGVGVHCQHFTLQTDRWHLWTRGAHCREHTRSYLSDELNDELMSHRNVCSFLRLTAEVSEAAAAIGSGGNQSLVFSAGRNVGFTEVGVTLCNTRTGTLGNRSYALLHFLYKLGKKKKNDVHGWMLNMKLQPVTLAKPTHQKQ